MRHLILIPIFLASVIGLEANLPELKINTGEFKDGIFPEHETLCLNLSLFNRSSEKLNANISWEITTDENEPVTSGKETQTLGTGETITRSLKHRAKDPGFYRVKISCTTNKGTSTQSMQVGYAPEKILPELTSRGDFKKFWDNTRRELDRVPPSFKLKHQAKLSKERLDVYEVTMLSLGSVRVSGWYESPKSPGPHPAVLRLPGYGQNMKPIARFNDMAVFSFNVRGHGNSQEDIAGEPQDYWIRGLDNKDIYYYRGAYMDCIRAMDFLLSRKEVDPEKIAVIGGSQGGGFSLATAAMDKRVSLCAPAIPFLTNWEKYFRTTSWPEMNGWIAAKDHRTWDTVLQTLSYFDTMNMASWIHCPVFMGVGLQDSICPPPTNFAVYNRVTGSKQYQVYPQANHSLGPQHHNLVFDWIRTNFNLQ
ncbi:MAG: acetylxylan esterase [Verrucomicrobiaceae bacterium]|nr:acetylxylan esterase [Verrucomicrobiaceae bacterium]